MPEELYAQVSRSFSDPEIVELTFLVGFINMLNWFNNALELRYQHDFKEVEIS